MNENLHAEALELVDDVDHFRVPEIRNVFLERQPQNGDLGALDGMPASNQLLHRLLGDELAHVVVDAAAGKNHLGMVAEHFRLVREVIRVDTDAVTADQSWTERQKIP